MHVRKRIPDAELLPPCERRTLAAVTLRFTSIIDLAHRVRCSTAAALKSLWSLRRAGFGRRVHLWDPARAGRPVQCLTYVKLRVAEPDVLQRFEGYCFGDDAITTATLLAGSADYALWSYHADESGCRGWLREIQLRPEVRTVDSKMMRVIFGHLLPGAPILPPASGSKRRRRSR